MVKNTDATSEAAVLVVAKVPDAKPNSESVDDEKSSECKVCSKKFDSLKAALSHELEHFKITETTGQPGDPSQAPAKSAKKKRKRQKKSLRLNNDGDCEFKQAVISALAL